MNVRYLHDIVSVWDFVLPVCCIPVYPIRHKSSLFDNSDLVHINYCSNRIRHWGCDQQALMTFLMFIVLMMIFVKSVMRSMQREELIHEWVLSQFITVAYVKNH